MVSKLTTFFRELGENFLKFKWKYKRPQVAKTVLRRKNSAGNITIFDLKLYHRAREIKVTV